MFAPWVIYTCIVVSSISVLVAALSLGIAAQHVRRVGNYTSKRSSRIKLSWKGDLPAVSIVNEHFVIADNGDLVSAANHLEAMGVDIEDAEKHGIFREQIAYLALCIGTLVLKRTELAKAHKNTITENFLEHRMLRRLLQKEQMRKAWPYARQLTEASCREEIDEYLLENYPNEKFVDVDGETITSRDLDDKDVSNGSHSVKAS